MLHFDVTEHPSSAWTAQQVVEAFPWDTAPRFLLRDRDGIYGPTFRKRVEHLGIDEVLTAAHSPWQNPFGERHLRRLLANYFEHYHQWRCHRSLKMDCPVPREVQGPERGRVVEVKEAGGLYRHYERRAA